MAIRPLVRLRQAPEVFRQAFHEREKELRAALLPDEETVERARAWRQDLPDEDEEPYAFF